MSKVLLIEDNPGDARLIDLTLAEHGAGRLTLEHSATMTEGLTRLARGGIDVVLLDLSLPDSQGLDTFRIVNEMFPETPVVVLSGLDHESVALLAVQEGAQDYLVKRIDGLGELVVRSLLYAIERKRSEEALRTAKRVAEAANRTRSHLVAVVTHEIRSPASTILGFAELLADTKLDAEQQEALGHIRQAASTLVELTRDLHDVSAGDADPRPLQTVDFDLHSLVQEAAGALTVPARDKGLSFECAIDPGVPAHVRGDPARLRQVLVNLGGNAIKFTERGSIRLQVSPDPATGAVRFAISDTGIGIPKAHQETIFEPFVQAAESIHERFGGAGLGLSVARSLVERMGGTLAVDSEVGRGSTFSFLLAFARPEGSTEHVPLDRPMRILLAEDSEELRTIIERYLHKTATTLDVVHDGAEAVRRFQANAYDLVLMDVEMPGMGGREATARIRAFEHAYGRPATPIVAVTAHALRGSGPDPGWTGHLTKPFTKNELLDLVRLHADVANGRPSSNPA